MQNSQLDSIEVKQFIRELIAEIAETSAEKIKDTTPFYEELGMDSVMALEVLSSLEKKYTIRIDEEKMVEMNTIDNTYEVIKPLLSVSA
ncbi:MAG: hypothetical protein A2527_00980 [Candidatus Lambdaproteobacteria bacterium RIFOXYD2_FULL_50_16]|uniref:Carrier domain-containing protein n=1 Tax=Candidatus Lambdaproteobacteria bacterium RIFOXYD2_FULL_50_16 TaxID=1817772 RepID=A0A1F6G9I6_9PROT|nr:MAG: hypothetical protein A2527_00980 [Candidatus Lambdaproteobacteria bacterium RIFOXYD2_FULL_50_16]